MHTTPDKCSVECQSLDICTCDSKHNVCTETGNYIFDAICYELICLEGRVCYS